MPGKCLRSCHSSADLHLMPQIEGSYCLPLLLVNNSHSFPIRPCKSVIKCISISPHPATVYPCLFPVRAIVSLSGSGSFYDDYPEQLHLCEHGMVPE